MKKSILSVFGGATIGAIISGAVTGNIIGRKERKMELMSEKHLALFLMMNRWVTIKQQGKGLDSYFKKAGYETIAVYGMSYAGERLVEELRETAIEIKYGIDENAEKIYSNVNLVTMESELPAVDAIVVTPIFFYPEIERKLSKKIDCPILSLEDILYQV